MLVTETNTNKLVTSGGIGEATSFRFSSEDEAHIMRILRSALYSDKIAAVEREIGANAWDAMREAGKGDQPIHVQLPTLEDPTFRVRDFGPGLSDGGVRNVFAVYGRSTKRTNNVAVGFYGIGSKSPYAYSDTFTVTSWHGGMKRVYVCALDASDRGLITLLWEGPCDASETGLEVQVTVKPQDFYDFRSKAATVYAGFEPRPVFNIPVELPNYMFRSPTGCGALFANDAGRWMARMGCVTYSVDPTVVGFQHDARRFLGAFGGVLDIPIGSADIAASRETLEYTDKTEATLTKLVAKLSEEYGVFITDTINHDNLSGWAKRAALRPLVRAGISVPAAAAPYVSPSEFIKAPMPQSIEERPQGTDWCVEPVGLQDTCELPKCAAFEVEQFVAKYSTSTTRHRVSGISTDVSTRFIFCDTKLKDTRGYRTADDRSECFNRTYDHFVIPAPGVPVEHARLMFEHVLKQKCMDGVDVVDLSTFDWSAPYVRPRRSRRGGSSAPNVNKSVRSNAKLLVWSDSDAAFVSARDRTLKPERCYVLVNTQLQIGAKSADTVARSAIRHRVATYTQLAAALDVIPCDIIGVRDAADIPADAVWFKDALQQLIDSVSEAHVVELHLRHNANHETSRSGRDKLVTEFGSQHLLVQWAAHWCRAALSVNERIVLDTCAYKFTTQLDEAFENFRRNENKLEAEFQRLYPLVPMHMHGQLLRGLLDRLDQSIIEYVHMCDRDRAAQWQAQAAELTEGLAGFDVNTTCAVD